VGSLYGFSLFLPYFFTYYSVAFRLFSAFECQVCGSYRRGKPQSGDIDVLITPSPTDGGDESFRADSIVKLIYSLTEVGLLTDHLTLPEQFLTSILHKELTKLQQNTESSSLVEPLDGSRKIACRASYMGVCKLAQENAVHRRIDIKIYPRSMYAFAILYFTGSDHFNRYG
jgi:DNA polymerase lambda